jgi:hypothetical protein
VLGRTGHGRRIPHGSQRAVFDDRPGLDVDAMGGIELSAFSYPPVSPCRRRLNTGHLSSPLAVQVRPALNSPQVREGFSKE